MEFSLFAPTVQSVELLGSWLKAPLDMAKDETGRWRVTTDIPDGRHTYCFRFPSRSHFMNGQTVDITDPRARLVDRMQNDASVIVIDDGEDVTTDPGFDWEHDNVPLPQDRDLTIYELHVGEFGYEGDRQGTFASVIDRLDYLGDLGVSGIEVMPVMAFPGDESWGYNVRHPFALHEVYGDPTAFKRFVDACHARGMRVIIDLVLNHSESEAPLTRIDFYYWYRDPRDEELSFGPKFDYEHLDETLGFVPAREHALDIADFWIHEYHIDGYRLDATAVLDNFDVVRDVRNRSKEVAGGKPFYVVAEQLPEDPAIAGPGGPADGAWHQRFEHAVVNLLTGEEGSVKVVASVLQPANDGYVAPSLVVNYVESHDEHTLMRRLAGAGIMDDAAFRRHKLAATLLFTAVGIPMLYQGQEFGGHRERDMDVRPLQWELLDADFGLSLKEHYAFMAGTRSRTSVLKGEKLAIISADEATRLLAYRRGFGEAEVVIAANPSNMEQTHNLPISSGSWREILFGYDLEIENDSVAESFGPWEAKIYVRR